MYQPSPQSLLPLATRQKKKKKKKKNSKCCPRRPHFRSYDPRVRSPKFKMIYSSLDMRPPLPIPPFQPRSVHAKQIYSTTTTLGVPIPSLPSTQQTKRRPRTATNFKKTHSDVLIKTKFPVDNETIPHKACCRCAKCSMIGGLFEGMRRGAELTSGRTPLA